MLTLKKLSFLSAVLNFTTATAQSIHPIYQNCLTAVLSLVSSLRIRQAKTKTNKANVKLNGAILTVKKLSNF